MLIAAESAGRRETMQQYFAEYGLDLPLADDWAGFAASDAPAMLGVCPLHAGFDWPAARLAVVTEAELYAGVVRRSRRDAGRRSSVDAMLRDLSEVRVGDPVVHEQHGIGRYLGLVTHGPGRRPDRIPAARIRQRRQALRAGVEPARHQPLQRRVAGGRAAARAGQRPVGKGEEARREQVRDTAAELLNLYAQRAARKGHAFGFKPTTTSASPTASASRRRPTSRARSRR